MEKKTAYVAKTPDQNGYIDYTDDEHAVWRDLDSKKVFLDIDDDARCWLAENGYDAKMGARPMDRLLQEKIKKPLAEAVLFGSLSEKGGTAFVRVEEGELVVHTESEEAVSH